MQRAKIMAIIVICLINLLSCRKEDNSQYDSTIMFNEKAEEKDIELMKYIENFSLANTDIIEKIKKMPESDRYYEIGNILFDNKKYSESIESYIKSVEKNYTKLYLAYYNIACAYSRLIKRDEALKYLELAIDNGYNFYKHLSTDEDLNYLRDDYRYNKILEKTYSYKYYKILNSDYLDYYENKYSYGSLLISTKGLKVEMLKESSRNEFENILDSIEKQYNLSFQEIYLKIAYNYDNKIKIIQIVTDEASSTGIVINTLRYDDNGLILSIDSVVSLSKIKYNISALENIIKITSNYSYGGLPSVEGTSDAYIEINLDTHEIIKIDGLVVEKLTDSFGKNYYDTETFSITK